MAAGGTLSPTLNMESYEEAREASCELLAEPGGVCSPGLCYPERAMSVSVSVLARPPRHKDSSSAIRRKREFIPDSRKDDSYWDKRKKNNEAAKRSREKRRVNDMVLENRVLSLLEENARLRAELLALKFRFGIIKEPLESHLLPNPGPGSQRFPPPGQPGFPARGEGSPYPMESRGFAPSGSCRTLARGPGVGVGMGSAVEAQDSCLVSEDSGISTPGGSSVGSGSPVFFEEPLSESGREELRFEPPLPSSHVCEPGPELSAFPGHNPKPARSPEPANMVKCLPHKLRFKISAGLEDSGDAELRGRGAPVAGDGAPRRTIDLHPDRGMVPGAPPAWRPQLGLLAEDCRALPGHRGGQDARRPAGQCQAGSFPESPGSGDSAVKSENQGLKTQLASLSAEVAQLKRMFSRQLYSNLT
uniref:Nuclear factor interleukin-3-regulated protein-like n=1 Tax=Callorhinchus milii TaxID=7868 RepID=A0A4W3GR09_CALMI|eukprot:gi/632977328/ref/XP_007905285.1/ PREDICTED: nuclear factor interleukin-3-regulated protein-like [Callorhinchus milii]